MSDRLDAKIRELTMRLMESAPEAPPFPEDTMTHLVPEPSPRRRRPIWIAAGGAAAVLVLVGLPLWLFGGNGGDPVADDTTTSTTIATTTTTEATTTITSEPTTTTSVNVTTTTIPGAIDVPTSGDCVLDGATYQPDPNVVNVYYGCFSVGERYLVPRPRALMRTDPPDVVADIETAMTALLAGPSPDEMAVAGYGSFFSDETAGMLDGVALVDGALVVDFADYSQVIPNASTSTGSQSLLDQLDATAFQFPSVTSVEYRFEGSCDAFRNWLQRECRVMTRGEWEADPPQIAGVYDEVQFALLTRVSATEVVADYAQWLTGDEANQAAFEDGEIGSVEEGVPNDYYIRNVNPQLRTLPLSDDVRVVLQSSASGPVEPVLVPVDEWLGLFTSGGTPWDPQVEATPEWSEPHFGYFGAGTVYTYYWLSIEDGEVVQIVQQYLP